MDRLIRDKTSRTAAMVAMKCPPSTATNQLIRVMLVPLLAKAPDATARWTLQDAAAAATRAVELLQSRAAMGIR
ncbi:MAG: hypothetical protein WKF37_10600 [Bryobacteraceae bacterium]